MRKLRPSTCLACIAIVFVAAASCGGSSGTSDAGGPAPNPPGGSNDAGGDVGPIEAGTNDAGTATDAGQSGDAGLPSDGGNGSGPTLPTPTGTCPVFANGAVTFAPSGIPPRTVQVYMSDAAKTMHGPLIFYWYATGSSATLEPPYALGATLASIESAGGIVVAPQADPSAGAFEWFIVNGSSKLDDFQVADEIVACAAQTTGIDTTHIHAMGMSAGGLQTTAMSFLRSSYLASVATYSGGMPMGFSPQNEDPANKFAALIFDGGATDNVFGVDFQAASQTYQSTLKSAGHFAAICDHGMGHNIPTDAAPSVAQFFQANGFGVYPSPYVNGLPATFPTYCTL
jgi:predicted esterase